MNKQTIKGKILYTIMGLLFGTIGFGFYQGILMVSISEADRFFWSTFCAGCVILCVKRFFIPESR